MDFARIKNLVKGNGDKLILMENGEPEAVVMSFAEYSKLANISLPKAAPARDMRHATEERFDMPSDMGVIREAVSPQETQFIIDEAREMRPQPSVRLADIRLEDLPI